jgi:plastocyanin
MNNKILAFIAMAAVGAVVSVGSADTVINAFVQQFGATPHTVITTPNNTRNVQIDWAFSDDFNTINACDLTFDRVLPNNTIVICKLSGHDANATDGVITNNQPGPIVGFGQIQATGTDLRMSVDVLCDPGASLRPQVVSGNFTVACDVQDIDDVKVIVVGKQTCDVIDPANPPENCAPGTPTPPPTNVTITDTDVSIVDGAFALTDTAYDPNPVSVPKGNATNQYTVTWTNNDSVIHTATSGTSPTADGTFDTGVIAAGGSATINVTLNAGLVAGNSYDYFCSVHPNMVGTLNVT